MRLQCGMGGGQRAETVAFDFERAIEARSQIFESDRRRQLDDLAVVEVLLQLRKDLVRHLDRGLCHPLSVAQGGALSRREERVLRVFGDRSELLRAQPQFAAAGGVNVDSEGTTDKLRDAETHEALGGRVHHPRQLD